MCACQRLIIIPNTGVCARTDTRTNIYIYIYIYIHTHTHTHIYIYIYIYIYTHQARHTNTHTRLSQRYLAPELKFCLLAICEECIMSTYYFSILQNDGYENNSGVCMPTIPLTITETFHVNVGRYKRLSNSTWRPMSCDKQWLASYGSYTRSTQNSRDNTHINLTIVYYKNNINIHPAHWGNFPRNY